MPPLPADFEETQPLDSPQSVDGGRLMDPHLFGETQALDDPDFDDLGICDWGKTQLIDDGDDDDSGTERTAVLTDGEGLSDDGASHCGGETKLGSDDMGSEKKESPVDSDASTDDEGCKGTHLSSSSPVNGGSCKSYGPVRRNFTSVRAASLRASSLAARIVTPKTTDITPKTTDSNPKSCCSDGEFSKMRGDIVSKLSCKRVLEFDSSPSAVAGLISVDDKTVEERDEAKGKSEDTSMLKHFNEVVPEEEEMPCGNLRTGLTYVHSQEPGSQSQANALDVVDNFLSINEIGLSQDVNTENAHKLQLTPISCAKGTRSLVQKVDLKSPVGKVGIFEWVDSLEDDGGGDFFRRKKDLFFEKGKSKKSQSVPAKAERVCLGATEDAMQRVVKKKGSNPQNNLKTGSFASSDSKLMFQSSLINDKALVSIKAKKNLEKHLDELSSPKHLEQQLEATGGGEDVAMHAVGPDTQMAAEAMEALGQNLSINGIEDDALPLVGIAEKPGNDTVVEVPSKRVLRRRSSFNYSENVGVSSECKRTPLKPHPKVSGGIHNLSRKSEGQSNSRSLANRNESFTSLNVDDKNQALVGTFIKNTEKCGNPLTSNDRVQVCEELNDYLEFTAIARRTRHFKTVDQRKQVGTSCCAGKNANGLLDGNASKASKRIDNPVVNRLDADKVHEEESNIRFPAKDVFDHPKRRRTSHNIAGSVALNNNTILKNQSALVINMLATTANPPTIQRKRTFIRSVCGIRDLAIQKKRTAFMRKASYFDTTPPNTEKSSRVSGLKTWSSMNSSSFKYHPEKNVSEHSREPICDEAGLADAVHKDSITATSDRAHNAETTLGMQDEVSIYHTSKEGGECSQLEQMPKGKVPLSALTCTTPLKDADAVSPVCMAQDLPRISSNKGLSMSSLTRELTRLDDVSATPSQLSKHSRRRKDMASVLVLFSHHLNGDIIKQQKKILARLGAHMASSMSDATHFVTDKFVRTRNMLEAIALGKPVVTYMWLESCGQASCFIDEKNYILRDLKKEKEIGFIMPVSLARSYQSPLLQGKRVFITPNVKPGQEVVASLVKAAHGLPIERIGRNTMKDDKLPDDLLVLSCEEDYAMCIPILEKGMKVFSAELILNGIVIQKLEYERHQLFLEHVKRTRSAIWPRCKDGSHFIPVTKCA